MSAVLIVAFSYFAFTVLAPWQLGKDADIVRRNHAIERSFSTDPVPIETMLERADGSGRFTPDVTSTTRLPENPAAIAAFTEDQEWTRVILTGHYLPNTEVLLRGRNVQSQPAYQSLIAFKLDSGPTILVNRGFELLPDEAGADLGITPAPTDEVSIVGVMKRAEGAGRRPPLEADGYTQVYTIDTGTIGSITNTLIVNGYVQLTADQPGELLTIPIPKLDRGSHLSYGFQWITFGIMAPAGLIYFIYSEFRERRRARKEAEELATMASTGGDANADGEGAPGVHADSGDTPSSSETTVADGQVQTKGEPTAKGKPSAQVRHHRSRSVADRYGDSKPDFYAKYEKRRRERF